MDGNTRLGPVPARDFLLRQPAHALPLYSPSHAAASVFCGQVRAATAHKMVCNLSHLLRFGEASVNHTEATYAEPTRQCQEKQLQRRAKELGYKLTKARTAAGTTGPAPQ